MAESGGGDNDDKTTCSSSSSSIRQKRTTRNSIRQQLLLHAIIIITIIIISPQVVVFRFRNGTKSWDDWVKGRMVSSTRHVIESPINLLLSRDAFHTMKPATGFPLRVRTPRCTFSSLSNKREADFCYSLQSLSFAPNIFFLNNTHSSCNPYHSTP